MADLGPYCFKNTTDVSVNGLHVMFDGTKGTLRDAHLTVGPIGRINATDNQLNIFLDASLAPGGLLCFTVSSEVQPITISMALWSANFNVVGPAEQIAHQPVSPTV